MNSHPLGRNDRILVVDDNPAIHDDFRKILNPVSAMAAELAAAEAVLFDEPAGKATPIQFRIESAFQGKEGLELVRKSLETEQRFAMAFIDVRMPPGWDGVETASRIWQIDPDLQVVICTAYSDYSWDEIDRTMGRADNLVILKKPFDNIEVLQLAHAFTKKWYLTQEVHQKLSHLEERVRRRTSELESVNLCLKAENEAHRQTEQALRVSEELFSRAFRASPFPMSILTLDEDLYVDVNEHFLKMTGYSREEVIGQTPKQIALWADTQEHEKLLQTMSAIGSVKNFECKLRTKSGVVRETLLSLEHFSIGNKPHVLAIAQDISEHRHLENQLRHAQKMEAVGKLAAGIAHDFNNVLTIIQGYSSLTLSDLSIPSEIRNSLTEILNASKRAATLTQQLLAFSRKQMLQPKPLDLQHLIEQLTSMLDRLIGDDVHLTIRSRGLLPCVIADAASVEQIVMNLVLNARDAMPRGGDLVVETSTLEVDESYAKQNPEALIGTFVSLSVIDSGCGMPPEVLSRVFEPFYTTKEFGKGRGMGLAMVYGIVKQHNGWIEVTSVPNQGSTFTIFLPAGAEEVTESDAQNATLRQAVGAGERILAVEDEKGILDLARNVLRDAGFKVYTAANAIQALDLWKNHNSDFDLLLTDVVMPGGLSGKELAEKLRADKKDLKVIFTSGYSINVLGVGMRLIDGLSYLQKPYRADTLIRAVRRCLDTP
jgi:two-component system, cell cycle sensor histidine kinase and response regulator CckA